MWRWGSSQVEHPIKRVEREEQVLNPLKSKLMDPRVFPEFCDEFTRVMNRLRMEGPASLEVKLILKAGLPIG